MMLGILSQAPGHKTVLKVTTTQLVTSVECAELTYACNWNKYPHGVQLKKPLDWPKLLHAAMYQPQWADCQVEH